MAVEKRPGYAQELLELLEDFGLAVRSGEMRRNPQGELRPVFVVAPKYLSDPAAADKVLATMEDPRAEDARTAFSHLLAATEFRH